MSATALPPIAHRLRWPLLLLGSAALHAALLGGWPAAVPPSLGSTAQPLAVALMPPAAARRAAPAALQQPSPTVVRKVVAPRRRSERPIAPVTAAPAPAATAPAETKTAATAQASHAAAGTAQQQALLGQIRLALARYFRYPPRALRQGWQGTVLVAFHVDGSGAIEAVRIAQSSGYAALDQAALDALAQVGRIPLAAGPLPQPIDLELPVIYRLQEG